MRLGRGFRQPKFETELGRRGEVTPPYGCNAGGAKQRADVGIGSYGEKGKLLQPPGPGAQQSVCGAVARDGWGSEQKSSPKGPSTSDNPSGSLRLTAPVVVPKILCSHTLTEF